MKIFKSRGLCQLGFGNPNVYNLKTELPSTKPTLKFA
jgi:hypothetical protein